MASHPVAKILSNFENYFIGKICELCLLQNPMRPLSTEMNKNVFGEEGRI